MMRYSRRREERIDPQLTLAVQDVLRFEFARRVRSRASRRFHVDNQGYGMRG
jgi:hypothetical protein